MKKITFFTPGAKFYENEFHFNNRKKFRSVSISGNMCALDCPHCGGKMLKNMLDGSDPQNFETLCMKMIDEGCEGILLSGGCNISGEVELLPYCESISRVSKYIKVAVHCGFASFQTLYKLKESGVSTVFFDVVGSRETVKNIFGIDAGAEDYAERLEYMKTIGLSCSPHIVVGLDYGEIKGEYAALDIVYEFSPEKLVLVVLKPLSGTKMSRTSPPPLEDVLSFFESAVKKLPGSSFYLGCARPSGYYSEVLEEKALDMGFSGIAYPFAKTVKKACAAGYDISFSDICCAF